MPQFYYHLNGTIRARQPEATLAMLEAKRAFLGITRVADITGLDHLNMPVVTCIRPNAKHLSISQGKGQSKMMATISAMMEAVEYFHMENPPVQMFNSKYQSGSSDQMIDPYEFHTMRLSRANLHDAMLAWTPAMEMFSQQSVCIPHIVTCLDTTLSRYEYAHFKVSTNGIAAGNTIDEAVCHALCEVIERDALTRWQLLSPRARDKTQINIDTIYQAEIKSLITQLQQGECSIKLWEITSSLNIPSFHCALFDNQPLRCLSVFTGTGTHLSKEVAISRAITEAVQSRLAYISGNRDDLFPSFYQERTFNPDPVYHVMQGKKHVDACVSPEMATSFSENKMAIMQAFEREGFDKLYIVNHTKADLAIPVVQAFIPGMVFNSARM
ncbi:MAG: YcaO-like family protein [Gammaproteobacteria bacterium]